MKRLLALLLTCVMLLGLFAACAKKEDEGDAPTPPDAEQGGDTPDDGAEGEPDNEPLPPADPYDAVKTYWPADQLTQA